VDSIWRVGISSVGVARGLSSSEPDATSRAAEDMVRSLFDTCTVVAFAMVVRLIFTIMVMVAAALVWDTEVSWTFTTTEEVTA